MVFSRTHFPRTEPPHEKARRLESGCNAKTTGMGLLSSNSDSDSDSDSIDLLPGYGVQSCWGNMSRDFSHVTHNPQYINTVGTHYR